MFIVAACFIFNLKNFISHLKLLKLHFILTTSKEYFCDILLSNCVFRKIILDSETVYIYKNYFYLKSLELHYILAYSLWAEDFSTICH